MSAARISGSGAPSRFSGQRPRAERPVGVPLTSRAGARAAYLFRPIPVLQSPLVYSGGAHKALPGSSSGPSSVYLTCVTTSSSHSESSIASRWVSSSTISSPAAVNAKPIGLREEDLEARMECKRRVRPAPFVRVAARNFKTTDDEADIAIAYRRGSGKFYYSEMSLIRDILAPI